jgi:predicted amidohydrolase YtcJ
MARTLLLGVRVLDPDAPAGSCALEIDGGRVAYVGRPAGARPGATVPPSFRHRSGGHDEPRPRTVVHELWGAVVTPAFVDAHVHATATGLLVDGLDLTSCPSGAALLDAVAGRAAARPGALIWGHGWQEVGWTDLPSRAQLDRAARGAPLYLSRIDVHSALVAGRLVDGAAGSSGWSAGPLTADAHHHARRAALAAVDGDVRDRAQRAFLDAAASRGVAVVHECAGPDISSAADLAALRAQPGPEVVGYWGEAVTTAAQARELLAATAAHGLAGDLFVDGSLGSHTAALRAPYADAAGCTGHPHLDAGAVAAHVAACTAAGTQAGFHVIGDAAADTLVAGLLAAGPPGAVAHRVEHLEMVDPAQMRVLAELGVVASVQPVFDAYWGGPSGMYAERLGHGRAAPMNPFAALHSAGVTLALGSDSPVTPVGPWAAVRAAVEHRTPGSGLDPLTALTAHTVGGHRAAGDRSPLAGRLVAGAPASYAIWDGAGVLDGSADPRCLQTVHHGRVLFDGL